MQQYETKSLSHRPVDYRYDISTRLKHYTMTLEQFISNIDFPLLREQKKFLLNIAPSEFDEKIDGLLGLIDQIQDIAVEQFGHKEEDVYIILDEDLKDIDAFTITLKKD
jgi:hypothetical protein